MLLVAVDAGGSATRAVVVDDTGRCRGLGVAGSANPVSSGPESVAPAIAAAVAEAVGSAGVPATSVRGAVVAMAGSRAGSTPGPEHAAITAGLATAGVAASFVVGSDLLAMFCAGTADLDGYALVAGTGSAAIRVRGGGVEAVADGSGWLLGDEGSGFWIGHQVARAVVADLDGRGPATALTPRVLDELGTDASAASPRARLAVLTAAVYADRPVRLARLAPLAFAVADADQTAAGIVEGAARGLVRTLVAVLEDGEADGPLVLGGSVALHQPALATAVEEAFQRAGGGEVLTVADGTAGAAVLALREHRVAVDAATFARLTASLDTLRGR